MKLNTLVDMSVTFDPQIYWKNPLNINMIIKHISKYLAIGGYFWYIDNRISIKKYRMRGYGTTNNTKSYIATDNPPVAALLTFA